MRGLNFGQGNAHGIAKVEVVAPPLGKVPVVEFAKGRRRPGDGVNAVGDGPNRVVGKHPARNLGMMHRDTVNIVRALQGHVRHIQRAVGQAACPFKCDRSLRSQDLPDQIFWKLIVARRHRSVGGEDAFPSKRLSVFFSDGGQRAARELLLHERKAYQGGVTLIHMVDLEVTVPKGLE